MYYRRGDRVLYKNRTYYITDGPIMGTEGNIYRLSTVPPVITVNERDLVPAPEEDDEK